MRGLIKYFLIIFFIANASSQDKLFTIIDPDQTGIHFSNDLIDTKENNVFLYANFYGGAGVGVGDFDNDGLDDLFFAGNLVDDKIYKNLGNLKFQDKTPNSGIINDSSWSTGVTVADVNNDGLLDIYVSCELYDDQPKLRTNKLYININVMVLMDLLLIVKINIILVYGVVHEQIYLKMIKSIIQ